MCVYYQRLQNTFRSRIFWWLYSKESCLKEGFSLLLHRVLTLYQLLVHPDRGEEAYTISPHIWKCSSKEIKTCIFSLFCAGCHREPVWSLGRSGSADQYFKDSGKKSQSQSCVVIQMTCSLFMASKTLVFHPWSVPSCDRLGRKYLPSSSKDSLLYCDLYTCQYQQQN